MNNLFNIFKAFLAPPVFAGDEERTRGAELVNTMLLTQIGIFALALLALPLSGNLPPVSSVIAGFVFLGFLFSLLVLLRRGYVVVTGTTLLILLTLMVAFDMFTGGTIRQPTLAMLILGSIFAGLAMGRRAAVLSVMANTLLVLGIAYAEMNGLLPPQEITTNAQHVVIFASAGILAVVLLNQALRRIETALDKLTELNVGLERRVADRTQALATVAEVSTTTSTILETQRLMQEVVDLAKERFNFYHAHIYLLDESGENLALASGAGEPGRQMLAKGLSIPLNHEQSLVARAARERKGVTVNDVTQAPDFLPNPLLPDTRSELAAPMIVGGRLIGVFDVQSDQVGRFTESDIDIQTTLASQVAVSIQNTRQYIDSMRFKLGIENSGDAVFATDVNGTITYANPAFEKVYGYTPAEVIGKNPRIIKSGLLTTENYQAFWGALLSKQSVTGEIINKHKDGRLVYIAGTNSATVNEAGEIVGFLAVHHDITEQKLNQDLIAQRARQQEAINLIAQKIQTAATIEDAMQVAARELGHALGNRQTLVSIEPSALGGNGKEN